MLHVGSVVLDAEDVARAVAFWSAALGYARRDAAGDEDFVVLCDPRRPWVNLSVQRAQGPKRGANRVHLDLYAEDQDAEVRRLESLGARRVPWAYPPDADFVVLADTEGNEFCVVGR